MVVGVNGAGKTTSIGKLTRHLAEAEQQGAARRGRHLPRRGARAARRSGPTATASRSSARKAATRPAVTFDAVSRRPRARLRRRHRRHRRPPADAAAPDGRAEEDPAHDRQGASRRAARGAAGGRRQHRPERAGAGARPSTTRCELTGLIVTKLDGTAKGGVLAAIALWRARGRACRSTSSASARSSRTCRPSTRASSRRRCSS